MLADGSVHAIYRKIHLPNYGVFDEQRYFRAGRGGAVIDIGDERVGLTICEDIWEPGAPASEEALAGATLIVNISASPYHAGKGAERERMFAQRAREHLAAVAFCALVGGQDELVFDGHSCVLDHTGATLARAAQFEEDLLVCDVDLAAAAAARLRQAGHRSPAHRTRSRVEVLAPLPARAGRRSEPTPHQVAPAPRKSPPAPRRSPPPLPRCRRCASRWRRKRLRCTPRSHSGCATTSRRTAFATSCSVSPAGSTPRSSAASRSTRSAPSA